MADPKSSAVRLDLRGYRCPVPVIRLGAVLRGLPPGAQVLVLSDDPVAAVDIPLFCREAGHDCAPATGTPETCVFQVTKSPKRA